MASCWLVRDVRVDMLVVKNQSMSLPWELNSIFIQTFWEKFYFIDHQHGCLVTWLQTKTAERLKIVSSKPAIKLETIRICLLKIMKQFTKSDWEVFAGCKIIYCCRFCLLSATQTRYRTPMPRYWEEDDCKDNPITRKVWLRGMRTCGRKLHVLVNCSEVKKGLQSDYKDHSWASKLIECHVFAA